MFFLVFFISSIANGQILNIDKQIVDKDSSNFFAGNFNLSGSIFNRSAAESNPVNLLGFNANVDLLYRSGEHAYIFITQVNYLKINDNPFLNTGFSHFRFHYKRKQKLNFEAFAQYQYDNFRQLNPRLLAGISPRLKLINTSKTSLQLASGIMYESETWFHPVSDERVVLNLLKSTSYIIFRTQFSDSFDLNFVQYYQTGYNAREQVFRNRLNSQLNILAKISKRFSFSFAVNFQYEDKPVVPITKIIYDIRNGIAFRF